MTADIVNLRRVRKAKARAGKEKTAEANRRLHGMSKTEREKAAADRRRLDEHVQGHKRDKGGEPQ